MPKCLTAGTVLIDRYLKIEQAAAEFTIQQLEAGGVCKAKRWFQREKKIKLLQHELTTGWRLLLLIFD